MCNNNNYFTFNIYIHLTYFNSLTIYSAAVSDSSAKLLRSSWSMLLISSQLTRSVSSISSSKLSVLSLCDEVPSQILIDISTDGANVYESVNFDIWPIQFRIINITDKSPMIAGIYAGPKKPIDFTDFFKEFNSELLQLLEKGISFNDKIVRIKLNCFIADTPARHACLNIKGHAGFNSCNKCKIPGERHKTDRTTIFKGTNHPSRTNEEYHQKEKMDMNHHHGYSVLHSLPLDLVRQTPLDYMHLVCLGVVKQIIVKAWLEGFYRPAKLKDVVKDRFFKPPFDVKYLLPM